MAQRRLEDALNLIGRYCQRYHLSIISSRETIGAKKYPAAYHNHMLFWSGFNSFSPSLNRVVLHSTSSTICATPELYGCLNLALSCCGGQTPHAIKSRKSIAAFKVMSGTLLGGRCDLRSSRTRTFCYKWAFLSAGAFDENVLKNSVQSTTRSFKRATCVGTSFFTFECGLYDYKAFEPLPGLYVQFDLS